MQSKRLQCIYNFINKGDRIADVGCDHGYLGIHALNDKASFVQFIDNKEGPLSVCKSNLANALLSSSSYKLSLQNGISQLEPCINCVCICGMGGETIIDIINNNLAESARMDHLILQPNNNVYKLRKYLMEHNFVIINEDICFENDKFYTIIELMYSDEKIDYSPKELIFGPILACSNKKVFIDYLTIRKEKLQSYVLYEENYLEELKYIEEILNEKNN